MNPYSSITVSFMLFVTICVSDIHAGESNYPSDIKILLNTLLPEGPVKADLIGGIKMSPNSAALMLKFRSAFQQNADSILEFMEHRDSGNSRPDPSILGMTEDEIEELGEILSNFDPVITKETFEIVKSDSQITFLAGANLTELESVTINMEKITVSIGQYTLLFADIVNIEDDQNIVKSKWRGYTWRYEFPEDLDIGSIGDISHLTMKSYKFTIGKLEKNGKTYMSIQGRELIDGVWEVRFMHSLLF